jgi:hypothetical protein
MAIQTKTRWSMVAIIGLALGCMGSVALADGGWVSSPTAAYTEVAETLLETNVADNSMDVVYAPEPGNHNYDPYTCTAAYGDEFCAAFERCMAAHGFKRCYERFSR